jgi:heat-inducible transcriptional repressor
LVLRFVVEDYVATAEPVGSRTISKRMGQALSPATIRNIMADLEEMGFLAQPHTSAGRIPTATGFRFYIDHLLSRRDPEPADLTRLERTAGTGALPADERMRHVGRLLSEITGQACVLVCSRPDDQVLRSVSLLPADRDRVLLVAVLEGGFVQHRLLEGEGGLSPRDLERVGNYLNELAAGTTLPGLRRRILEEMRNDKARYDRLLARALSLGARALAGDSAGREVHVEGRANVLDQPEFAEDVRKLKRILSAFEEKSHIVRILDRALESDAVQVSFGEEAPAEELPDIAVVASPYRLHDRAAGTIGLVGPVRMDYSRVIPLVEYTAGLLGTFLDRD